MCDIVSNLASNLQMRIQLAVLSVALAFASVGCKKDTAPAPSGGGGGGGGGGGSGTGSGGGGGHNPPAWLVGGGTLLAHVGTDSSVGEGDAPVSNVQLNGIACRYEGEAWVVGNAGTLLYTNDGGTTWTDAAIPTSADLRTLATQDDGPVFIAGNGTFLETDDTGATWRELGDGVAAFRSVAAAQDGGTVLAISDDGGIWTYDGASIARTATLTGAHAVALSPDGELALVVGEHAMWRSTDAGVTWASLPLVQMATFDDVRLDQDGNGIAVGEAGAVALLDPAGTITMTHVGTANLHTMHIGGWGSVGSSGFTAGDGGQVYITEDGGWNWTLGPNLGETVFGMDSIGEGHR
jgi:photosystem II stability/assembly factor-like uncharacterized protein